MTQDRLYQEPLDNIAGFTFDHHVVSVFPDMIKRSVPGYSTIIAMTGVLAGKYAQKNTNIYDLGTSLGASLLSVAQHLNRKNNFTLIGVDNSKDMLDQCASIIDNEIKSNNLAIDLRCENIEDTLIHNASLVILNFSLQFIPPEKRNALLKKIYQGMNPGSVLLLSEKIMFEDEELNQLNIELHHQFKKANGYTDLEISQKRSALEDVLIPETLQTHQSRLQQAGFSRCDVWFQCFNFASLVAIK